MEIGYIEAQRFATINSVTLILPGKILDIYEYENRALVILHPDTGLRNILCLNERAEQLWTIEESGFFPQREGPGYETVMRQGINRDGRLVAYSRGRPFFLDIETGKVEFIPGSFEK